MDIHEKYSNDEIEAVRKLIRDRIEEIDIDRLCFEILDLINEVKQIEYMKDNKFEDNMNDENSKADNIQEFLDYVDEMFDPENQEDKEYGEQEEYDEIDDDVTANQDEISLAHKIQNDLDYDLSVEETLQIILNDQIILEELAIEIEEFEYDLKENDTKCDTIETIMSALALICNVENMGNKIYVSPNLKILKSAISNKIEQLDYPDFIILMMSYWSHCLVNDTFFEEVMLNKINGMSNGEFAKYLASRQYNLNTVNSNILKVEENKAKGIDSSLINYVYNMRNFYLNKTLKSAKHDAYTTEMLDVLRTVAVDSVTIFENGNEESGSGNETNKKIANKDEFKLYLELMSKLYSKEFVKYLLSTGLPSQFYGNEKQVITENLKNISTNDLIVLVEDLYFKDSDKDGETKIKLHGNTDIILAVAKKRGIVTKDNRRNYSKKEINTAQIALKRYGDIIDERVLPDEQLIFNDEVEADEYEYEDDRTEEEKRIDEYIEKVETISERVKLYDILDFLTNLQDNKVLLKLINRFNSKFTKEKIEQADSEQYGYIAGCLKSTILAMPTAYSDFLIITGEGCLDDAIELKIEELQEDLAKVKGSIQSKNNEHEI